MKFESSDGLGKKKQQFRANKFKLSHYYWFSWNLNHRESCRKWNFRHAISDFAIRRRR